jgi:hypothetical protein
LPPLAEHSLAVVGVKPLPLQLFWPLHALVSVLHAEWPLQALTPVHLTVPSVVAGLSSANAKPVEKSAAVANTRAEVDKFFISVNLHLGKLD